MSSFLFLPFFVVANSNSELQKLNQNFDIVEDNQGYIWIAGQNGLNRLDGKNIINFAEHNKNWSVPYRWVNSFSIEDENLIVATESQQLWLFSTVTGESTKITLPTEVKSIYSVVAFDNKYYFYETFNKNIYSFDKTTQTLTLVNKQTVVHNFIPFNNRLFFYNSTGIYEIKSGQVSILKQEQNQGSVALDETFVLLNKNKLLSFHKNQSEYVYENKVPFSAITKEKNTNNFYAVDVSGVIKKFDAQLNELEHGYRNIQAQYTEKLFHDSSNVLWLMNRQSVHKLTQNQLINHPHILNSSINSIELDVLNNELILASYGSGLKNFNQQTILPAHINDYFSKRALIISDIQTVEESVYIATFDGLWKYSSLDEKLIRVDIESNAKILLSLKSANKILYITTNEHGVILYDVETNQTTEVINDATRLSSLEILDTLLVSDIELWLASAKGLDIYNKVNKSIANISLSGSSKVTSLTQTKNKIYVATKGDGVFIFNKNKELLSRIAKGINLNNLANINHEIWATSNSGLYRINPLNDQITMVPSTETYSFTSKPIRHGNNIFIGHYNGVLEIPLSPTQAYNPKVYISQTNVSGNFQLRNKLINTVSDNDVITLHLASLDFRSGIEKQFRYKINQGKWQQVNGNQLTLTGLASGEYRIVIQGTNSLGQWSEHLAFADINVAYPWFWTPKIRIVYAILAIALISMLFWLLYLRGRSINHIHTLLSNDLKSRGKVALNVSRQLNNAIDLLDSIPKEKYHENDKQIKRLLHDSINEINAASKSAEPDNLSGKSLTVALPYLCNFLHNKHHVNFTTSFDFNESLLSEALQADIYKIIYEALSSAIYNSQSNHLTIKIKENKNKLWLAINDDQNNFVNFNNKINFDMAMYYIRQVASKYNAAVHTFDEQENGSQLTISIPLMKLN